MTTPKKRPRHKLINIKTTDLQIADTADALWHYAEKIEQVISANNMSSNFRDKLNRNLDRLRHYAKALGAALTDPDDEAFANSLESRRHLKDLIAKM